MQGILKFLGLQWLLQPSVSILGLGIAAFLAAFVVLLIVRCFEKWKMADSSLVRALLISACAVMLILLYNIFADQKGNGSGPEGPAPPASTTPATTPASPELSILHHVDIICDFRQHPAFTVTFQTQSGNEQRSSTSLDGSAENPALFWKNFEEELYAIKARYPDGQFLFTLIGVESAQVADDIRSHLRTVFPDRLYEIDTIHKIDATD